ncbi:MAG: adenosylcobinamide-phosphate synthase CbiB [Acidobacteriota bacterium]
MESPLIDAFLPRPALLVVAVAADLLVGDPVYPLHPVRIIGRLLTWIEKGLRRAGADGYAGGILLLLALAAATLIGLGVIVLAAARAGDAIGWLVHVFFVYSFLAMGDLLRHVWRVERALMRNDLHAARTAVLSLVGRDVDRMDGAACRRASIESLSENLTDGFTSPLFWYAIGGLPCLAVFKVVSTMDSMVGYKTPRYLRFGWCGARLDDVMNYVPARLTWLLIGLVAALLPSCSGRKALRIGFTQHAILLGPNSGWSEAAAAGGLARRLVGPIWARGRLVTDVWIGDPADPPLQSHTDVRRGLLLVAATGISAALVTVGVLIRLR